MWTAAYVSSVVGVNVIFGRLPYPWSVFVGSAIVGGIFILRDLAQREIGHRVLFATLAGIGVSYVMAAPAVSFASALAFGTAELADWAVFSLRAPPVPRAGGPVLARLCAARLVRLPGRHRGSDPRGRVDSGRVQVPRARLRSEALVIISPPGRATLSPATWLASVSLLVFAAWMFLGCGS